MNRGVGKERGLESRGDKEDRRRRKRGLRGRGVKFREGLKKECDNKGAWGVK